MAQRSPALADTTARRVPAMPHASIQLRRLVDAAVGSHYDTVFLRLDLLLASREGRCGCAVCAIAVAARREELAASLPPLGA
jgi:hypothetical protein